MAAAASFPETSAFLRRWGLGQTPTGTVRTYIHALCYKHKHGWLPLEQLNCPFNKLWSRCVHILIQVAFNCYGPGSVLPRHSDACNWLLSGYLGVSIPLAAATAARGNPSRSISKRPVCGFEVIRTRSPRFCCCFVADFYLSCTVVLLSLSSLQSP
jgi:hypothetical protein